METTLKGEGLKTTKTSQIPTLSILSPTWVLPSPPSPRPSSCSFTDSWSANPWSHYLPKGMCESYFIFLFQLCFGAAFGSFPVQCKSLPKHPLSTAPSQGEAQGWDRGRAKANREPQSAAPPVCYYHFTTSWNLLQLGPDQICSAVLSQPQPGEGLERIQWFWSIPNSKRSQSWTFLRFKGWHTPYLNHFGFVCARQKHPWDQNNTKHLKSNLNAAH